MDNCFNCDHMTSSWDRCRAQCYDSALRWPCGSCEDTVAEPLRKSFPLCSPLLLRKWWSNPYNNGTALALESSVTLSSLATNSRSRGTSGWPDSAVSTDAVYRYLLNSRYSRISSLISRFSWLSGGRGALSSSSALNTSARILAFSCPRTPRASSVSLKATDRSFESQRAKVSWAKLHKHRIHNCGETWWLGLNI